VALANLVAAAAVNVGLFLLVFRVLTPRQIPTRQLVAGALVAGVAWQVLQAVGGYLVGQYLRHTSQVYGVFAIVLGLLFWLYLGARLRAPRTASLILGVAMRRRGGRCSSTRRASRGGAAARRPADGRRP
jgi:virulence factor BrkB